jgi:site-specific recombinase XerD
MSAMTLEPWSGWRDRYLHRLALACYAPGTIRTQRYVLKRFIEWMEGMELTGPGGLTSGLVKEYRRHRIESTNARGRRDAPGTVNMHLAWLRQFFRFLAREGAAPSSLVDLLEGIRMRAALPRVAPRHEDVVRLLEAIPGDTPIHLRDRTMLELLYLTGLRRQELADLDAARVDLAARLIRVERGKGGKGRVVPMGRVGARWLAKYIAAARPALAKARPEEPALFVSKSGRRLSGGGVSLIVSRWADRAAGGAHLTPHAFRRSCVTGMIRNRANVSHIRALIGHAPGSDLSDYTCLDIIDVQEAHRQYHPRERDQT